MIITITSEEIQQNYCKKSQNPRNTFCRRKEEAERAAGRLPIHFVRRDDVVGAARLFSYHPQSNVLLMEEQNIFL